MEDTKSPNREGLLADPDLLRVTGNVNPETRKRMEARVPSCPVFTRGATRLVEDDRFVFRIDTETARELPRICSNRAVRVLAAGEIEEAARDHGKKRTIGIVFSGGPAPGGHNVIAGVFDAAKAANPESRIVGFLMGPDGIIEGEAVEITAEMVDLHRNLGGFSMIKTGRTKIDSKEKMELSRRTIKSLGLDALVVVGGDDSNTNAAFLAQEMLDDGVQVIGVPKTIDGDIQVRDDKGQVICAMSFGFHTAARAFAGAVANLCTDASSDVKYWHICKVMGRVASHLALEVALQTHANITLIGEDLAEYLDEKRLAAAQMRGETDYTAYGMTLRHLSRVVCDCVVRRAAAGKNYGVIVIPEGVLEFINEIQVFIIKLNTIIADYNQTHDTNFHHDNPTLDEKLDYLRRLARRSREDKTFTMWNTRDDDLFNDIPAFFQEGLLMERDSHGNFPFSQVETDKVILGLVRDYLGWLQEQGAYRVGIPRDWFVRTMAEAGLSAQRYGSALFENWSDGEFLLTRPQIVNVRTLTQALAREGLLAENGQVPKALQKVHKKSIPSFKTQTHFYGYDGRGADPTWFDATYTYNLGLTVFALIANGATGQMAAIRNLELGFDKWEPMGVPIAALMRLEERSGKLSLVIEKSLVDTRSPSFEAVRALREVWLSAHPGSDNYRRPGPILFTAEGTEDLPITLALNALERIGEKS
ncbi:MAG: 6-phosphofructokinase [Thermodesulfobacteriota bacterium]